MADDSDLPDFPEALVVTPGRYRHYKGGEYEVISTARHSESLELMVVYRALYGDRGLWVRPAAMFKEYVRVAGELRPRFNRIASAAPPR